MLTFHALNKKKFLSSCLIEFIISTSPYRRERGYVEPMLARSARPAVQKERPHDRVLYNSFFLVAVAQCYLNYCTIGSTASYWRLLPGSIKLLRKP